MNRRKFLENLTIAASLAAASPLASGAVRGPSGGPEVETPTGFPISHPETGANFSGRQEELANGFINPPKSAAPWVYWMWINVDTTPAAMTFDLEQMKAKGIAGFILYNSPAGGMPHTMPRMTLVDKDHQFEYQFVKSGEYTDCYTTPIPFPPLVAWTPLWRERIRYVAKEAARLDLKFCLNMGLSGTSGQIAEEYGNQKLVWSETTITGPATYDGILSLPGIDSIHGPE